jgi:hypothetical protein
MDVSSTVASWLSLAVTVAGLGSIATQFSAIIDQADPFHSLRDARHLGNWWRRQSNVSWYSLVRPPPLGPLISANLPDGLCGQKTVCLSRLPLVRPTGQAAWSILLSVVHPISYSKCSTTILSKSLSSDCIVGVEQVLTISNESPDFLPSDSWAEIPLGPLTKSKQTACILITRGTLMALLCLTNARPVFHYSGASGHRAAYAAYCGQWRVDWPIGDLARVYFCAHDSHFMSKDMYPITFEQRVDKCLQMLAGVVDSPTSTAFKVAFPGRKQSGKWILQYAIKGFGGAHSGRHLYNMIGGNVNEVDFLLMKAAVSERQLSEDIVLHLPSTNGEIRGVTLYVPQEEAAVLNETLDKLPWTFISWSIHRGLRDILTAFSKDRMDCYRGSLADTLRFAVAHWPERLDARGWDPRFVRDDMADIAASAVLAGQGNSGDAVRVVTEIAAIICDGNMSRLDETHFWRSPSPEPCSPTLSPQTVVALVKCFVLEWSMELDYQMYHDLPIEMYLG